MKEKEVLHVPIRLVGKQKWGALAYLVTGSQAIDFIAEKVDFVDGGFSFADGHRVRRYRLKKQIHFTIPEEIVLDIEGVQAPAAPRRRVQGG